MSKRSFRFQFFTFGVLILCLGMQTSALPGDDWINLTYEDEALTDVMEKVSEASGFTIVVNGQGRGTRVSGTIENLPLEEAVRLILNRFSSTVVWDEKNKTIMISVYDSSLAKGSGDPVPIAGGNPGPPQSDNHSFQPADTRDAWTQPTDRRGSEISGQARRFIQGTRTTEP